MSAILFLKAQVKGHTRQTRNGTVYVNPYNSKAPAAAPDLNEIPAHVPASPEDRRAALDAQGLHHVHPDSPAAESAIGPWGRGNPRIREHKAGKHPPEWGPAPEGASHAVSYNYGKGPVTVFTKRTRYGDQTYDDSDPKAPKWSNRSPHHLAWSKHVEKHGAE